MELEHLLSFSGLMHVNVNVYWIQEVSLNTTPRAQLMPTPHWGCKECKNPSTYLPTCSIQNVLQVCIECSPRVLWRATGEELCNAISDMRTYGHNLRVCAEALFLYLIISVAKHQTNPSLVWNIRMGTCLSVLPKWCLWMVSNVLIQEFSLSGHTPPTSLACS